MPASCGLLGPKIRLGWAARFRQCRARHALSSPSRSCSAGSSTRWRTRKATARLRPGRSCSLWSAAWVGFGLFMIVCSALVALYADRLAHRRRQVVLTEFFEHVLAASPELPRRDPFRTADEGDARPAPTRCGDYGSASSARTWSRSPPVVVLMPLSLYLNWRLGLLLIGLCLIFVMLNVLVLRQTEACKDRLSAITRTSPSTPPTRSATSLWCRASPASSTRCAPAQCGRPSARCADPGAVLVGTGLHAHQGGHHA